MPSGRISRLNLEIDSKNGSSNGGEAAARTPVESRKI